MQTEERKRPAARLHNILAQHPLCFSPLLPLLRYDVSEEGRILFPRKKEWPIDRGYKGRVLETRKGMYCIGYYGKSHVEAFLKLQVFFNHLPTQFDRKVLSGMISALGEERTVVFPSVYALLKRVGISTKSTNYDKVIKSLWKWTSLQLHFIGEYELKVGAGTDVSVFGVISRFVIPNKGEKGPVKISFDMDFLEMLFGENTVFLEHKILLSLNSESAINLYSYLKSFDFLLTSRPLKREIGRFSDIVFPTATNQPPSRIKARIQSSIQEVNKGIGKKVYSCSFSSSKRGEIVSFIKAKETP